MAECQNHQGILLNPTTHQTTFANMQLENNKISSKYHTDNWKISMLKNEVYMYRTHCTEFMEFMKYSTPVKFGLNLWSLS